MKRNSLFSVERLVFSAKCLLACLFAMPSMMTVNAQNVGDAFYIYRNDGQFNAFFRDEVDSIAYSCYDIDSVYYDDVVTQVVYTQDSIYRIPLAAIDSVGFVQPETIYKDDAIPLTGNLFDYLISADGLCLTFNPSIPLSLLPKVDDKLVTTELTDKLPCGFLGIVRDVSNGADGFCVCCDSLALEDAVTQFYGVVELTTQQENGNARRYLRRKAPQETTHIFSFNLPQIHPHYELTRIIKPKEVYNINGKASADVLIKPYVTGKLTRVVDVLKGIFYLNLHTITEVETTTTVELAGEAAKDDFLILPIDGDYPMPWGYPLYLAFGPQFEISGELAVGTNIYANARHIEDITYYPISSLIPITSSFLNTVNYLTEMTHFDMDWMYFAARGSIKLYLLGRVGIPFGRHEVGWVGAEFECGVKGEAELSFDIEDLVDAEKNTRLYNSLKENSKVTVKPYWGATPKISAGPWDFKFFGRDDFSFWGTKWEWDLLPKFANTKASSKGATSANATTTLTNECLFPYTVGFSVLDENEQRVGNPQFKDEKYRVPSDFPSSSYSLTFDGLQSEKKYKAYPTLRFFGMNMLGSPSADIDMHFPVTIDNFKQTKSQHKKGGFTHEGVKYDYRYDVAVTVSIDDLEGVADWGYVYRDPNGKDKEISLQSHGTSYTDNSYAYYRNTSPATITLMGYVRYEGSSELVYGEPTDYTVSHADTSCPDSNHPHMIDLGLPSGTKWACCNVGATKPEQYGGYYAWGEVSEKSYYDWSTYSHCDGSYSSCHNLGSGIAGTQYDVAHVQWGGSWVMPSLDQIKELLVHCSSEWTTENGVYGRRFTGSNGGSIFLPAAGYRWYGGLYDAGESGHYWSSTQEPYGSYYAFYLKFYSGNASWYVNIYRYGGLSVRPVVRN